MILKQIAQLRSGKPAEPRRLDVPGNDAPAMVASDAPAAAVPSPAKAQVLSLMARARAAISSRDFGTAEMLLQQAMKITPPASQFGPQDDRPELVLRDLRQARTTDGVRLASGTQPLPTPPIESPDPNVAHAFYDPRRDTTANAPATNESAESEPSPYDSPESQSGPEWPAEPAPIGGGTPAGDEFAFPEDNSDSPFEAPSPADSAAADVGASSRRGAGADTASAQTAGPTPPTANEPSSDGARFYALGEKALLGNDPQSALAFFRRAAQHAAALAPAVQARLQQHLETLEPLVGAAPQGAVPAQFQAGQAGLIAPGKAPGDGADSPAGRQR